jgi:hypothetical protein
VHVGPEGTVYPGVCAGIVLGTLGRQPSPGDLRALWERVAADWRARPVLSVLAGEGPFGLAEHAREFGYEPGSGYASKCHLCWEARRFLVRRGRHFDEIGPPWLYADEAAEVA